MTKTPLPLAAFLPCGLFGSLDGVLDWGIKLRNGFFDESPRLADVNVVHNFAKRQLPSFGGDWGYGFMKPTKGSASCGRRFSLQSFGHTGFTGTSLWMDPAGSARCYFVKPSASHS